MAAFKGSWFFSPFSSLSLYCCTAVPSDPLGLPCLIQYRAREPDMSGNEWAFLVRSEVDLLKVQAIANKHNERGDVGDPLDSIKAVKYNGYYFWVLKVSVCSIIARLQPYGSLNCAHAEQGWRVRYFRLRRGLHYPSRQGHVALLATSNPGRLAGHPERLHLARRRLLSDSFRVSSSRSALFFSSLDPVCARSEDPRKGAQ